MKGSRLSSCVGFYSCKKCYKTTNYETLEWEFIGFFSLQTTQRISRKSDIFQLICVVWVI